MQGGAGIICGSAEDCLAPIPFVGTGSVIVADQSASILCVVVHGLLTGCALCAAALLLAWAVK